MIREKIRITKKSRIGVLYGGTSAEREISLRSGRAVLAALESRGYRPIGIDPGADLVPRLKREKIEVVFLALHGGRGEDGSIQGLLETLEIPYTGSGVLASALGMDKLLSRIIFQARGITVPRHLWVEKAAFRVSPQEIKKRLGGFPVVVKPRAEGSSLGVGLARNARELQDRVKTARAYGGDLLIEEFVSGAEVHVGILAGKVMGEVEVVPRGGFYDYRSKYTPGMTEYIIPARVAAGARRDLDAAARAAYLALGCDGVARVDCIYRRGKSFVLEVNTIPGLTETSLIPKIARASGRDYPGLVEAILMTASLKGGGN
ncbi:MAG: D-alanine--D-alanine ligase [bacterium]|nr:D-alanine--D-alanine ligase [bacterium]